MSQCPQCGEQIKSGRACACGWGARDSGGPGPKPAVTPCEWRAMGGRQCLMAGSVSLDSRRWLCSWHCASLSSPRTVDDFEEFTAWVGGCLDAALCAEWTHWPVGSLWNAVQGRQGLAGYRSPCAQSGCPHRDLGEWQGSPGEALAQIRRDVARIGRVGSSQPLAPLSGGRGAI